jgi:phosphohistidine phosphatase SixA
MKVSLKLLFAPTVVGFAFLLGILAMPAAAQTSAIWEDLRGGGHVALLRHAIAPGTGDPQNFVVDNCQTQRNLSDVGRDQARRIGARFRDNGIDRAAVFSSQWCRCLETAALLDLGAVQPLPILNSFFRRSERREPQTQALRQWIAESDLAVPTVLVTHYVNITALTGVAPASGELVVVRREDDGSLSVVGTIETD